MKITTERLELVAGTLPLIEAELANRHRFAELLGAQVPANWPPPLNDAATMQWCERFFKKYPDEVGWANWYFVLREGLGGERVVIGNGGFGGKPTADGMVEVGYSVVPEFQRLGYATEAVRGLIHWAFAHPEIVRIVAETYPESKSSIRVIQKNGFLFVGPGSEPGVIRYELKRSLPRL